MSEIWARATLNGQPAGLDDAEETVDTFLGYIGALASSRLDPYLLWLDELLGPLIQVALAARINYHGTKSKTKLPQLDPNNPVSIAMRRLATLQRQDDHDEVTVVAGLLGVGDEEIDGDEHSCESEGDGDETETEGEDDETYGETETEGVEDESETEWEEGEQNGKQRSKRTSKFSFKNLARHAAACMDEEFLGSSSRPPTPDPFIFTGDTPRRPSSPSKDKGEPEGGPLTPPSDAEWHHKYISPMRLPMKGEEEEEDSILQVRDAFFLWHATDLLLGRSAAHWYGENVIAFLFTHACLQRALAAAPQGPRRAEVSRETVHHG
ncbi:hypothetical protein FB45DRAFT_379120 [Roridomyces roridus]|uniref:Uncharacterized protein n=1 Tax=Roridomyces roridus TaxID=1738132 RepID=A0AAD7B3H2_9AGAR|nr:hypothetical protein FB45DRAFT_379120 [Roridomyces roridus]